MRRAAKWVGWTLLVLLLLPVVVVAAVFGIANLDFGQRFIERETASLTGGTVRLEGLHGRFPDALRINRVLVSDSQGVYVTVSGLALDWSPTRLLSRVAEVDHLSATAIDVPRLPVSEPRKTTTTSSSNGSFSLPVQVDLRSLTVDRVSLGEPVAGAAAELSLNGDGYLRTLTEGRVRLDANRIDGGGQYHVNGNIAPDQVDAHLTVAEPPKGLISSIAKLPDLGAVNLDAAVKGPMQALGTQLALSAGPLAARADGTVDATHQAADLQVHANAPAMQPAPGVAWQSIKLDAKVIGPFTAPDANGTVRLDGLSAGGAQIGQLAADIKGNTGQVALHATVTDLHIPGPQPDILAASPVTLDATSILNQPDRPTTFNLRHTLLQLQGSAQLGSDQSVQAHLTLPDLAPLAKAGGANVEGHTELDLTAARTTEETTATVQGPVAITGGMAPLPALIGPDGHIDLAASLRGQDITLSRLNVNGKAIEVTAQGGLVSEAADLNWTLALSDLAALTPSIAGKLNANGHVAGPKDSLSTQADIVTDVTASGYRSGQINAHIDASGLPNTPKATVTADGTLLDAPLNLALTAEKTGDAMRANISRLAWKSLQAEGNAELPNGARIPTGDVHLSFTRLADLQPLLNQPLSGAADATLHANDQSARVDMTLSGIALAKIASVNKAVLGLTVDRPADHPVLDGTLTVDGVSASSVQGLSAKAAVKGPLEAIATSVTANAQSAAGGPARLTSGATVNATDRQVTLSRLEAGWKSETLRLLAPAKIAFADGVGIDRLRLGLRQAELTVSGSAGQKLDLTASLRNLPADIAAVVEPSMAANGVINADARLTGSSSEPEGTVRLTASGVQLRNGPGQSLPPANLIANVGLQRTTAKVDTKLTAGPSNVTVTGTAPLSTAGSLDLRTDGRIDLTMLDPILSAQGRRARGIVTINASATGKATEPRVNGTAQLTNGDVVDYSQGAHVSNLTALVEATGDTIRLSRFNGKAGPGTLGGSGTIGLAGAMPIDLHFTADNARPLSSDLLTALIDADLYVQGEVKGDMKAGGTLKVRRADIRIPDKLPPSIAVLPVRQANAPPPPPQPPSQSQIALDLTLEAPQQVFVRGRGLDAELGGTIHITGTTAAPIPNGGLQLRRGTLSIIGTTLNFTEGTVTFTGAGISDPSIHFVATSTTPTVVAMVTVSGSAKDPKVTLSSVPDMPQDEILAQLLFNTSTAKLSPLQLAQIASALASLSGASGGFDPLDRLRTAFGLDRLSVGSNTAGNPTVEAGRYVARGVYVGAKQSTSGGGPQATVQVDLAKGLKLETTAGSAQTTATGASSSTDAASVGLTYQFEY